MLNIEGKNIVLLIADCGRYDRFLNRVATSYISTLGDLGWVFNNAISPYNQTKTVIASMFTGLLPSEHLIQSHRDERFNLDIKVLAEIMKDKGYNNIGVNAFFWMGGMFGWDTGFDEYLCVSSIEANAQVPTYQMYEQIKDKLKEPFFLYMHTGDTHVPYNYPKVLLSEFGNEYDASLKFFDMQVRALVESLPKNTIFIITADHGVGLGEYGGAAWGQGPNAWLYDIAIHVPMIVYTPGLESRVINDMFSTKDIFHLITKGELITNKYVISESYAYHHESCINQNLCEVGRRRAMMGYRCVVNETHKLIEGEDKSLVLFRRGDETEPIRSAYEPWLAIDKMYEELKSRSKMDLKARRPDIIRKRLLEGMGT